MRVADFLKDFANVPDDYYVTLSKIIAVDMGKIPQSGDKEIDTEAPDGTFTIVEDIPIVGVAVNDADKEIRLVVSGSDMESFRNLHKKAREYVTKIMEDLSESGKDRAAGEGTAGTAAEAP